MQDLLNTIEKALANIISASGPAATVFIGQESQDQVRPSVTVYAQHGEEWPISSGNYYVQVAIQIRSLASQDSIEQHRKLCRDVEALIDDDSLATTLSSDASLTVQGPPRNKRGSQTRDGDAWLTEFQFELYSCLQELA